VTLSQGPVPYDISTISHGDAYSQLLKRKEQCVTNRCRVIITERVGAEFVDKLRFATRIGAEKDDLRLVSEILGWALVEVVH